MSDEPKPEGFSKWPQAAIDSWWERICIMREANNIPDDQPTPEFIQQVAIEEARFRIINSFL